MSIFGKMWALFFCFCFWWWRKQIKFRIDICILYIGFVICLFVCLPQTNNTKQEYEEMRFWIIHIQYDSSGFFVLLETIVYLFTTKKNWDLSFQSCFFFVSLVCWSFIPFKSYWIHFFFSLISRIKNRK